jgi:vesicle coat complex subunit
MNVERLIALDPTIIKRFFMEFKRLQSEYSIKIKDIYNMNKTGFQLSQTTVNYVMYDPVLGHLITPASKGNHQ